MKDKVNYPSVISEDIEGYYGWNLKRAREKKDVSCARELIHGFCDAAQTGKPIPTAILEYLYQGFVRYLAEAVPIEEALLLTLPRHRRVGTYAHNPIPLVATLHLLRKRDGLGAEEAKEKVMNTFHVTKRTLEKYDSEWNLIRNCTIEELAQLAQPVASSRK